MKAFFMIGAGVGAVCMFAVLTIVFSIKSRSVVRQLAISYGHAEYVLKSNTSDEVEFRWLPPCVGKSQHDDEPTGQQAATIDQAADDMTRAQQAAAIERMKQRGEIGNATPEPRVMFVSASIRSLLDAIRQVETGGHADPANAIGDDGASLGPYQISRAYWTDADVEGRYEHVKVARYAERVMIAYWSRYCFDALIDGDFETLARVHNGGPAGARKDATLDYWRRVSEIIAGDVGNLNESEAAR